MPRTCVLNQVILWDKVVESAEEAHLLERDMTVKYGLIDEVKSAECETAVVSRDLLRKHLARMNARTYTHTNGRC